MLRSFSSTTSRVARDLRGAFSEQVIGLLIAIVFVAMLVFFVARVALGTASAGLRIALGLMTLGMAAVALYPASVALHLGHPVATATLGDLETSLALPSGGSYRVLVSGRLHEGHDARIAYRLNAGGESVDGALERQYMTRRARRGAAIQVPEDHDVEAHDVTVSGAPPALVLESVSGKAQLQIQAYRVFPPGLAWAVMAAVLLAAAFLDAKVAANGVVASAAAAAVCFGLIIKTGNPVSIAWPTLWGAVLAAGGGALGGSVLAAMGRKVCGVPAAGNREKPRRSPENQGSAKSTAPAR